MKKAMKKLMAALLAVAMVCAMATPAFAYNTWETEEDLDTKHDYGAFQIFTGDVSEDNKKISNVAWGQNITEPDIFLDNLKLDSTIGNQFSNAKTAQDVLAVISTWHDSDDYSIAFARFVCKYLYPTADAKSEPVYTGHTGGFEIRSPGYYLIVDTSPFSVRDFYHAYNSFMLTVTKAPYHVQIKHKVVKPTVEKKVYDNDDKSSFGDNNDWCSSADHAINEEFKFRLIAKLPASKNNGRAYDFYDKYTVLFNDTLSEGITYDRLDSVVIESNDQTYNITKDSSKYEVDDSRLESDHYFVVGIPDVKTCVADAGFNLNNGATITVTYTAHLNDKAAVNASANNKNSVRLQYSNNPKDSEAYWGFTPESEVYVYTYQLNNTKYHDKAEAGNELAGAGFRLYSAKTCNATEEIKLKKNTDGTYSRYFGTEDGEEMFSNDKGQFNVKGLDAGTYYLKETTTPTGYNTCGLTTVTIKANHTGNRIELDSSNLSTTIINNSGTVLPSTGGIGTTIFYVVGGGLMVAAAILLITKKRMENH